MLKITQKYGKLSWLDVTPIGLFGVPVQSDGSIQQHTDEYRFGTICTSSAGPLGHKSCAHLDLEAVVDISHDITDDVVEGTIGVDGVHIVDSGSASVIRQFSPTHDNPSWAGRLDLANRILVFPTSDYCKVAIWLECIHWQSKNKLVYWYPSALVVYHIRPFYSSSGYYYGNYQYAGKSWFASDRSIRKTELQNIPEWTMSWDDICRQYFNCTVDLLRLVLSDAKYDDPAISQEYTGSMMPSLGTGLDVQRRIFHFSKRTIKKVIDEVILPKMGSCPPVLRSVWGDLCHQAIQSASCDSNAWTLYDDLREVGSEIASLSKLIRKPDLKNLSGLYLNTRYGTKLTLQDLQSYGEYLSDRCRDFDRLYAGYDVCRAMHTIDPSSSNGWSGYDSVTCYVSVKDSMLDIVVHSLQQTGIGRLSNVWDIIPFSFVVDWFLDVGSVFEELDYRWNSMTLNTKDVIYTSKRQKTIIVENFLGCSHPVSVTLKSYTRSVGNKLSYPSLGIADSSLYQNHVLDLTMIGLQILS